MDMENDNMSKLYEEAESNSDVCATENETCPPLKPITSSAIPSCTQFKPSPETVKNVINSVVISQKFRAFIIILTLFTIISFITRVVLIPSGIANNQLFSDLSILVLVSVTSIVACAGFWKIRMAFITQPNSSPSSGLNLLKSAVIFFMIMTPATLFVNIMTDSDFLATMSPQRLSEPQFITIFTILAILMIALILSPVILYFILSIRMITFMKKLYKTNASSFPVKTVKALGVMSRIAGIAIFLIAFLGLLSISNLAHILGFLTAILNAVVFLVMGNILLEIKNNLWLEPIGTVKASDETT